MDTALYQQLRAGTAAIYPLGERSLWKLSGPDRGRYLNGQTTNDVKKLQPGHALYAGICNAKGKLVGDLTIAAGPDALWLETVPELRETLGPRLERYLIADDASLEDVTGQWHVTHLFGSNPPTELSDGVMAFSYPRFGLPGWDVWTTSPPVGSHGASEVPSEIAEALRIEHGIAQWGREMDENSLAPEALTEHRAISYTKGCYVGQEVISRLESVGHVNKELRVLAVEGDAAPAVDAEVTDAEGKRAGKITSVTFSPALGGYLALGLIARNATTPGTTLSADGKRLTVIAPPLSWQASASPATASA